MSDFESKLYQVGFPAMLCPIPHWGAYIAPLDLRGIKGFKDLMGLLLREEGGIFFITRNAKFVINKH